MLSRVLSVLAALVMVGLVLAEDEEVCFDRLGCFSMEAPWKTLLRPLPSPMKPEEIPTRVYFYSASNPTQRYNIDLTPNVSLNDAPFDAKVPVVFITHGFASNGNTSWLDDLKTAYLNHSAANVFIVDWGAGSSLWNYLQVASNTRVAAKEVSLLAKHLVDNLGAIPEQFHLIGHSLGAHIMSYVAKLIPNIGRLTALDPAQPGFEGFDQDVRLDKSDAKFVDVIHTDARPLIPTLGFGMITPYGHVDFYMNGGFDQPGCIIPTADNLPSITSLGDLATIPVEVIGDIVSCPHGRSYEYFTESLIDPKSCIFWGHEATTPAVLKTITNTVTQGLLSKYVALSPSCSKDDCTPLGYETWMSPLRGSYVVTTAGKAPFCISEPGIPPEVDPTTETPGAFGSFMEKAKDFFG